ncbi:MAG TPA: DUF5977 domain-containing protein, partial [Chitinophagaceae bacterium]|nr:DUF5977 domain-containing protein [Chitinophagaceae bacterium]
CMLSTIKYPTGGSTSFIFESNASANFGGARIAKIINTPVSGLPVETNYTYTGSASYSPRDFYYKAFGVEYATSSSPGTSQAPVVPSAMLQFFGLPIESAPGHNPMKYVKITAVPQAILGLGAQFGYSSVVVSQNGIGSTSYRYESPASYPDLSEHLGIASEEISLLDNLFNSEYISYYARAYPASQYYGNYVSVGDFPEPPVYSNAWKRGMLLTKTSFSQNGNIVKREEYSYQKNLLSVVAGYTVNEIGPGSSQYIYSKYYMPNSRVYLGSTITTEYDQNGKNPLVSKTTFFYDNPNHLQASRVETSRSDAVKKTVLTTFPLDYPSGTTFLDNMISRHIIASPVETIIYLDDGKGQSVVAGTVVKYGDDGSGLKTEQYVLAPVGKINATAFKASNRTLGQLPPLGTVSSFSMDERYLSRLKFNKYDNKGNLLEVKAANEIRTSYIWGYNGTNPVAEVLNAASNEIFYEGFEEGSIWPNVVGGWPDMAVDKSRTHTGGYAGKIFNPNNYILYYHSPQWLQIALTAPTKYKYSGWFYSDGPQVALYLFMKRAGETGYLTYVDATTTTNTGKWIYLEKEFEVPADVVQLNVRVDNYGGGSVWFDDIRLHPSSAKMTTYTYAPLIGMTSQSDINSRPTYYEYDLFGRLYLVRDFDKNILKKYCYNYAGQTSSCAIFGNEPQTQTFTKVCTSGIGSQVAYTVAADTYSAGTQSEANALAIKDIEANGQAFANQQGTCTAPPPPVNVNISGNNYSSAGYYVYFLEVTTNQSYSMYLPAGSSATLTLLSGNYKVSFTPAGTAVNASFRVNGYSTYGTTATFNNITIGNGTQVVIN